MDAKLKETWTTALRSGKYRQSRGMLRREDGSYCCLGVLCAVNDWSMSYHILSAHGLSPGNQNALIDRNDGKGKFESAPWSFEQIADYIEEHL